MDRGKREYYRDRDLPPQLAARYYQAFGDARTILDLGCGTGTFAKYRPSSDITVHGVDSDPEAVAAASEFEEALCLDLSGSALPFGDEMFDGVLAKDIFEHLQDPGSLALEVHRVLKPNGMLVVSVVMAKPARVWADYTHVRGFTREAAKMLLQDAGFGVEKVWQMGPVPGARRLGLVRMVPHVLRLPLLSWLWASSWEITARRVG